MLTKQDRAMKRSRSLGGLKIIAESEEMKHRSFFKFPFFHKKKSRHAPNTISASRSEQGIECKNGERRTLMKSVSVSCLSKVKEDETPISDCLRNCNLVTDQNNNPYKTLEEKTSQTNPSETFEEKTSQTNPSKTFEENTSQTNPSETFEEKTSHNNPSKTLEEKANTPSLTTKAGDLRSHSFRHFRELQTATDSTQRNSQIIKTRLELESAINKDDRDKLLSAIRSKTFDLNDKDCYDKTLLHSASSLGNYRCAQILINAGADVNIRDQAGFAPLHCAVVSNHVPCAAVLISAGANLVARTNTMHTPLTLAHQDEMILMIGRSMLLRGTTPPAKRVSKDDTSRTNSLRETYL